MSKLITDSKTLTNLLFDGTAPDDNSIYSYIENLKKATLTCCELCVTIDYEDRDVIRKSLNDINFTLTETWKMMASLQNDFKDLIDEYFKQWIEQCNKKGGRQ